MKSNIPSLPFSPLRIFSFPFLSSFEFLVLPPLLSSFWLLYFLHSLLIFSFSSHSLYIFFLFCLFFSFFYFLSPNLFFQYSSQHKRGLRQYGFWPLEHWPQVSVRGGDYFLSAFPCVCCPVQVVTVPWTAPPTRICETYLKISLFPVNCRSEYDYTVAVSCRLYTAAARVRFQVISCVVCGGPSDTGAGFLRVLRFPLSIIIAPTASHSFVVLSSTPSSRHRERRNIKD
jgi:hypothetical protein